MKKIDWEKLAKQLQEALSKEMKEVERLEKEIAGLNCDMEELRGELSNAPFDNTLEHYADIRNKNAVICYLERRLFEEMRKNQQGNEEIPF